MIETASPRIERMPQAAPLAYQIAIRRVSTRLGVHFLFGIVLDM